MIKRILWLEYQLWCSCSVPIQCVCSSCLPFSLFFKKKKKNLIFLQIQISLLFKYFRIATGLFRFHQASLQTQHQNFMVRLTQSKSPFKRWRLFFFLLHSNKVFLKTYNSLSYSLHTHTIWKRSMEKYESSGTLSTTTHFLSVFCEVNVVQRCTEEQAGLVQDRLQVSLL